MGLVGGCGFAGSGATTSRSAGGGGQSGGGRRAHTHSGARAQPSSKGNEGARVAAAAAERPTPFRVRRQRLPQRIRRTHFEAPIAHTHTRTRARTSRERQRGDATREKPALPLAQCLCYCGRARASRIAAPSRVGAMRAAAAWRTAIPTDRRRRRE